jgi:hypothetical protein
MIFTWSLVYNHIWLNLPRDDHHFGYKHHWGREHVETWPIFVVYLKILLQSVLWPLGLKMEVGILYFITHTHTHTAGMLRKFVYQMQPYPGLLSYICCWCGVGFAPYCRSCGTPPSVTSGWTILCAMCIYMFNMFVLFCPLVMKIFTSSTFMN